MERSKCRSCGADIIWARTSGGNLSCFDADPSDRGTAAIVDGVAETIATSHVAETYQGPKYLSHFATCPQAPQWRKKRGGE